MSAIILRRKKLGLGSCKGITAVSQTGITFVRNDQMKPEDFEGKDLVIRWGCTSNVPIENVLNTAQSIHTVSDKSGFRKKLLDNADTANLVPPTFFNFKEAADELEKGYTLFVRPKHHAQGKKAYLVENLGEFISAVKECGDGWYASYFVDKVAEYRVFVVLGRVVWVASKTPADPEAVVWNVAQGGKFENVKWGTWDLKVCDAAIKAMKVSGLDFGGVDVMVDHTGHPYIIEINSAPSQTSPYRQQCTAKAFDYVVQKGKDFLGLGNDKHSWKSYIHPGVWS